MSKKGNLLPLSTEFADGDSVLADVDGNPRRVSRATLAEKVGPEIAVPADGGVASRTIGARAKDMPNVEEWRGDGGDPSDTAMTQAAVDWAKANGGTAIVGATPYTLEDEIDLYSASTVRGWGLSASSFHGALFTCVFDGYDKAVFKCRNPSGGRARAPELRNIRVAFDASVTKCPVGFDLYAIGNPKMDGCFVSGPASGVGGNTHYRITAAFNGDGSRIGSYFGGHKFGFIATDGVTFSITSASTTLTASSAIFAAGHVGRSILVYDNVNDRSELFSISGYTDSTHVTVSLAASATFTSVPGVYEDARCAVSGTTVTADAPVFTDPVGLTIYIFGAGTGGGIHKAKITARTSNTVVTIDTAAPTAKTDTEFTVPPVTFDSTADVALAPGITNDLVLQGVHIEDYRGVGLVMMGQSRLLMPEFKIHAAPSPTDANSSIANIWMSESDPTLYGTIEGRPISRHGMIRAAHLAGRAAFGPLNVVLPQQMMICSEESNSPDGLVDFIGGIDILNTVSAATKQTAFGNQSVASPRIRVRGLNAYGGALDAFPFAYPGGIYKGEDEPIVADGTNFPLPTLQGASTAGTFTYVTQQLRAIRRGRGVQVSGRIVISAIGTPPVGNMQIANGVPYQAVNVSTLLSGMTINRRKLAYTAGNEISCHVTATTTTLVLHQNAQSATPAALNSATAILSDTEVAWSGWYEIALA